MDLREEMKFVEEKALENPKNYQIWHHRRVLTERLNDCSLEDAFTRKAFEDDSKNYHAWSYRQWVVQHFKLWDDELPFVDELLAADVRNNSAWNQRYFVIDHTTPGGARNAAEGEIKFAQLKIEETPCNDSAWNYLKSFAMPLEDKWAPTVCFCDKILEREPACVQAMDVLVHVLIAMNDNESKVRAANLCDELGGKFDTIRRKFWDHMAAKCA